MKILVTGASGFIGSFIVERALDENMEVWAGVRKSSSLAYLQDKRIHFADLNYANPETLKKQLLDFGKFDIIVHAAGVTKANDKSQFERVNFEFTKNFIEALIATNTVPERFIYLSSLNAYGHGDDKTLEPMRIEDTPTPDTLYGISKLKAEKFITSLPDFPYIIIRPTGVYGPREKDYFVFIKTMNNHIDAALGFETQYLTFIYVKDLVKAIFLAMKSDKLQTSYFIADGNVYTDKEYADIVKKCLNTWAIPLRFPLWIVKGIATVLDTVCGWFGVSPTLNKDKYKILRCRNWKCDISAAEKDLGFHADYDLKRGTEESIIWYRNEKWI